MDVFDLKATGSVAPFDVKTKGVARTTEPAIQGNALPESRQEHVRSEFPPHENAVTPLNTEELSHLVDQVNEALSVNSSHLTFTVADGTNIVRIEDSETGELIRQIPSETMLAIARAFDEITQGVIIEERV